MSKENSNYLTTVRDYYGLTHKGKTCAVFIVAILGSILFGPAFAFTQVALVLVGILLNKAYPKDES
ncbi:hypothetical protein OKZ62_001881 [Vibrio navarrensis]|nr:hypothetical protein [Vibrio navarrensis]